MKCFALFDKKSGTYFSICLWKNAEIYKRSVYAMANHSDPQNLMFTHPTDFELWQLGEFNEYTGEFENEKSFVCSVADLRAAEAKEENNE